MEGCCISHGNLKKLGFSEHSPFIKEKYLPHIKDLYITISCGYPSLCMGENTYIVYNQTTATFQYQRLKIQLGIQVIVLSHI